MISRRPCFFPLQMEQLGENANLFCQCQRTHIFLLSPSYSFSTLRFFRITHILYLYPSINVGDKIDVVKKLQVSMKTPGLLCLGIQALKQEEEEEEDVMMVFSYRLGRNIEIWSSPVAAFHLLVLKTTHRHNTPPYTHAHHLTHTYSTPPYTHSTPPYTHTQHTTLHTHTHTHPHTHTHTPQEMWKSFQRKSFSFYLKSFFFIEFPGVAKYQRKNCF